MEGGTSTLNQPFPPGPTSAHMNGHVHGPTTVRPEDQSMDHQTYHKPFFYVQPPQPYLPVQGLQWPLPLALNYSHFYGAAGYPGFGYGLPLMPQFQPSPFMEAPGFVMPHTHLHLMDYRRLLNPHYYQSMAYHARRLRYQQNTAPRDVTSSEVQTEPLPASQRSPNQEQTSNEASHFSKMLPVQKEDGNITLNELAPIPANPTPQKGSFVIETEEVRIQCCATPAGLQVLHPNETAEMFAQDVVHCSSIVQNSVLAEESSQITNREGNLQPSCQVCPDILIVATPNSDKSLRAETPPIKHSQVKITAKADPIREEKDFKVVRLPFDATYFDEFQKIESTVWSTEDTLVPSPGFLIDSSDETLKGEVPSAEVLVTTVEMAQEEAVPVSQAPDLKDVVPALDNPTDAAALGEAAKQDTVDRKMEANFIYHNAGPKCSRNVPVSDDSQIDAALQDTSFESLPAYLPSTSWLSDFENASYCKRPLTPQKFNKHIGNRSLDVPARRRKLDAEFKEAIAIRKPKERYKPTGKADNRRSLSDHECCVSRSYNENLFVPYSTKAQRLCLRCLSKQRPYKPPASPAHLCTRKFTTFQPRNDRVLPTCETCKGHMGKRFIQKDSGPVVRAETEGESSENGYRRHKMEEMKRPLAVKQIMEKCQTSFPKLRERNCLCGERHQQQVHTEWQRFFHCPHGDAIMETQENLSKEQVHHGRRWQTEKSWKTFAGHNMDTLKNNLIRAQRTNLHNKSLPLTLGTHRKDTRC